MANFFTSIFISSTIEFGTIQLDAKINERFQLSSVVTDNPVDDGAEISDHSYNNPRAYSFRAVVTDTPSDIVSAVQTAGANLSGLLNTGAIPVSGSALSGPADASKRSVAAFFALIELWESRTVLSVQTALGLLENMKITSITTDVTEATANILDFTVEMRQLTRVELTFVSGENKQEGEVQQAGTDPQSTGLKQGSEATANVLESANGAYL